MAFVFNEAPTRIYWELTRACDLACRHCRAEAGPMADPRELPATEIVRILEEFARESAPHVVLTGGDPLKRRDFFEIVERVVSLGLPCNVSPSATSLLTSAVVERLALMRVAAVSLSLDGSTEERHDGLRGVAGTFARTVQIARDIARTPISLQINTLVCETVDDLPAIHSVVRDVGAARWSLFFLIATGRGKSLTQISPARSEEVMNWVLDRADERHPVVTTTEAPHFRRIALTRRAGSIERPVRPVPGAGVRDGNGVMFISHAGNIQPSGFLPLTAGSARVDSPLQVYRESPLFRMLRRPDLFAG